MIQIIDVHYNELVCSIYIFFVWKSPLPFFSLFDKIESYVI